MANSYYQRKATIDSVNAKKPEALRRDKHTDYTSGYFFVTLNIRDHKPLLGTIRGNINPQTQHLDVSICLSKLGEIVQQTWQTLPQYHPNVQIIDSVIMPEHFHGLLYISHIEGVTLGHVIKGFKLGCNRAYKELCAIDSATLFSSGFNETVPLTPEEIDVKKQYIHDNPKRRFIKDSHREHFAIIRGQSSPNWTKDRIIQGLCKDYVLSHDDNALQSAMEILGPRLLINAGGGFSLDYIGSRNLLLSKHKLSLICHRVDVDRFAEQSAAVFCAAKEGTVIVSPFISPKEREILNQLLSMGASVIEIVDNGFGKTYKPYGNSFYACAEGKLLQISCWNYLYQRNATITRPMCMVMNELARLISGVEDDWWKKV